MAKKNEGILELLVLFPWWVSVSVAGLVYVGLRFVVPAIEFANPVLNAAAQVAPEFAWVASIFLIPAAFSALESRRKRRMLDQQSGLDSIRSLRWKQFEELLGEAYRRQGYRVVENERLGPDGGIDLILLKGSARYLVQAKQWKSMKVGVKVVREMFGVMTAERADGVFIVTSGLFTQEAKSFAANKPIDLVDGPQLLELIQHVQTNTAAILQADEAATNVPKTCPRCGKELVIRVARKGERSGSQFWGCSGYPNCFHTEQL